MFTLFYFMKTWVVVEIDQEHTEANINGFPIVNVRSSTFRLRNASAGITADAGECACGR